MIYIRKLFSTLKTSKWRSQLMLLSHNSQGSLKHLLNQTPTPATISPFCRYSYYPVYNSLFIPTNFHENDMSHIKNSESVHIIELNEADEFNLSMISEVESINLSCSCISV